MKKIEAIIRKTKFEDVKEALLEADIEWFSYYDVRGIGKSREARIYRGVMYDTSSIERILVSIVVRDKNVERTVNAIQNAARTGEIGDGRIFIIPIEDAIRIRVATSHYLTQNKKNKTHRRMKTLIIRSLPRLRTALLISLLLMGTTAFAEEADTTATADKLAEMATGIDTVWMLLAAIRVSPWSKPASHAPRIPPIS